MGITPEDRSYSNSKNLFFGVFMRNKTYNKKKMLVVFLSALLMIFFLIARLVYLMIFDAAYYQQKAKTLHEREREIKAARGEIIDRNGKVLATNKAVCTISVIHSQITDPERVIQVLADELGIEKEMIRKRIEKVSSREKIKTNVEKETGDRIRAYELDGVKVDEDFKRYYPYGNLASKVLGFTGGDNQGIIGLEVKYENYLKGVNGMILTTTDARGIELADTLEDRVEPVSGDTLQVSLDYNIQEYAQQAAEKVMEEKQADAVVILILNPKTGEIYACVNAPEFDLNAPFTLPEGTDAALNDEEKQAMLNQMWRNRSINDTYEPGSIFKVFTASAALEEGVVKEEDTFYCPGYKLVEDRRIRCARTTGHGSETFVQGVQNSCNPVFIEVGMRLGTENFYKYFEKFGLMGKTGVDLPGEAATIMHKKENVGQLSDYGDINTLTSNPDLTLIAYLAVGAVMLIWMLSTFFFTLSGIRHGTGRGLTYFVLVYVLSYLFSLAAAAIPADVQLLTGIRGGILVFGSLYPTYFPFCVVGIITCILRKILK